MVSQWHRMDKTEETKRGRKPGYRKTLTDTKVCCLCKKEKLRHHFGKDKSRNDGIEARCKPCNTVRVKNRKLKQEVFSSF